MMLPGVELARRRRVHHHHEIQARGPPEPTVSRPSIFHPTVMDESVIVARRRLEEKLRRFSVSSPPSSSPSAPSLNLSTSRPRGESSSSCGVAIPEINSTAVGIGSQRPKRHELKRSVASRTELCAVCLDDFVVQQTFVRLPCSHKYHSECLLPWLAAHSHCPCCRTIVPSLNLLL